MFLVRIVKEINIFVITLIVLRSILSLIYKSVWINLFYFSSYYADKLVFCNFSLIKDKKISPFWKLTKKYY